MTIELPGWAFYYPNSVWNDSSWVKNIIPFFEGVTLLVPGYMLDRPFYVDEAIATGLRDHGLLKIFNADSFIDQNATETLAKALSDILASGTLDKLAAEGKTFQELSYSRLGSMANSGLAEMIIENLRKRGLASVSKDGVSIPIHPLVRSLILTLWAQILISNGKNQGYDLNPATDRPEIQKALVEILGLPSLPSSAHVVSLDVQTVGLDLSPVPLDEIVNFRTENRGLYRKYIRDLRKFAREIANLRPEEQQIVLRERQAEIAEAASELRRASRQLIKQGASTSLGLAGAVWRFTQGDILGGLLALGAGVTGAKISGQVEIGAYSYLLLAGRRFS